MAYKRIEINGKEYLAPYAPMRHHKLNLQYTASGYGAKLPTPYIVYFNGRDRRIYVACFSNAGTAYIIVNGARVIVSDIG